MTAGPSYSEKPPLAFIMLLGAMSAVPAMTMDMYLPSMPEMTRDLGTTQSLVQGTISGLMIGAAVGQLLWGPISDRFGRRRPFMVGVSLHVVMSIACAFSPDIYFMLAARILQGVGNAATIVAAMAALRDRYNGPAASSGLSGIQSIVAIAPLIAPSIGGFIAHLWGWRAVFIALALVGLAVIAMVALLLEETHPPERRTTGGVLTLARTYGPLIRDPRFLAAAIIPAMATTTLYTYISTSSFAYMEGYGLSEQAFVAVMAANGIFIIFGAQLNSRLVIRAGQRRMLLIGLTLGILSAAAMLALTATGTGGVWGFAIPMAIALMATFMVMPNGIALALAEQGNRAGSASAVVGATQQALAALLSPMPALLGGRAPGLAVVILGALILGLIVALALRPRAAAT